METSFTDPAARHLGVPERVAFKSPDRYRMEGMSSPAYPGEKMNLIYDGSTLWVYLPKSNRYTSVPSDQLAPRDRMMGTIEGVFEGAGEPRLLREETIAFDGDAAVECYVIRFEPGGATSWIDQRRFIILREDTPASSTIFKTVKLNEPLSDDLFKFTPPEGAAKIELPR
jgi:outer membrane lipoprotein-sorting protein